MDSHWHSPLVRMSLMHMLANAITLLELRMQVVEQTNPEPSYKQPRKPFAREAKGTTGQVYSAAPIVSKC